jgi:hypothetical protein
MSFVMGKLQSSDPGGTAPSDMPRPNDVTTTTL